MKLSREKLRKIVQEEMARAKRAQKKGKTFQISEDKLREMIRQECVGLATEQDLVPVEPEVGGCGSVQPDKHGALANPPQEPFEAPLGSEYMHPAPMIGMEETEGEDDDLLYDVGY